MIKYNNPLFMNLGGSSDSSSISNIKTAMVLFQSTSSDGTHSTIELNDDVSNYGDEEDNPEKSFDSEKQKRGLFRGRRI